MLVFNIKWTCFTFFSSTCSWESRCVSHQTVPFPSTYPLFTHRRSFSSIYFKSKYLQNSSACTHSPLYEDCFTKRSLHSTSRLWKEERVVEKSVKALKDEVGDKKHTEPGPKSYLAKKWEKWTATLKEMKRTGYLRYFWNAFKSFVLHYKDGFVLFWKNLKYCMPLLKKYVKEGRSSLKRREYKMVGYYKNLLCGHWLSNWCDTVLGLSVHLSANVNITCNLICTRYKCFIFSVDSPLGQALSVDHIVTLTMAPRWSSWGRRGLPQTLLYILDSEWDSGLSNTNLSKPCSWVLK